MAVCCKPKPAKYFGSYYEQQDAYDADEYSNYDNSGDEYGGNEYSGDEYSGDEYAEYKPRKSKDYQKAYRDGDETNYGEEYEGSYDDSEYAAAAKKQPGAVRMTGPVPKAAGGAAAKPAPAKKTKAGAKSFPWLGPNMNMNR